MSQGNKKSSAPSQNIVPIKDIKEGVIIMKDGSLRSIVSISSINLSLKSETEKESVSYAYQSFLNSIEFPIQILSVSRKLDLTDYLTKLETIIGAEQSPFIKIQAEEYKTFIEMLLTQANIMDKEFYIVVSFYPVNLNKGGFFGSKTNPMSEFEENKKGLMARIEQIVNGVTSMGLTGKVLNTEQIADLIYILYNPDIATNIKIGNAINSISGDMVTGK